MAAVAAPKPHIDVTEKDLVSSARKASSEGLRQSRVPREDRTQFLTALNPDYLFMSALSTIAREERPTSRIFDRELIKTGTQDITVESFAGNTMKDRGQWGLINKLSHLFATTFQEWGENLTPEDFLQEVLLLGESDVMSVATVDGSEPIGAALATFGSTNTVIHCINMSVKATLHKELTDDERGEIAKALEGKPAIYFAEIFVSKEGRHISPLIFVNLIYTALKSLLNQGTSGDTKVIFFTKDKDKEGRRLTIHYFAEMLHMKKIELPTMNEEGRYAYVINLGYLALFSSPIAANSIIWASRGIQKARKIFDNWVNRDGKES